ncbi:MAG: hypothetical protein ACK5NA_01495, partial [Enterococcus sp.]
GDANGDEKRRDITGEWGTQVVHAGDVVRSWVTEAPKNWHYIDENPVDETQGKNAVYYEVTSSGYEALQFNQLTPRTQSVGLNASTSDLDAQLSNYVDTTEYPDIDAIKFVSYPDTSQEGESEGVIQIAEKLTSGKRVLYNYTVPFQVEKLAATTKTLAVTLGSGTDNLAYSAFIDNVQLNGRTYDPSEYTVKATQGVTTQSVGAKTIKLRVTLKEDTTKTVDVEATCNVRWGSTVALGGVEYPSSPDEGRTVAAFTLLDGAIVATQGNTEDNYQIHTALTGNKYYTFDWFDLSSQDGLSMTDDLQGNRHLEAAGYEKKQDVLARWTKQPVTNGDIVRAYNSEAGARNWLYNNASQQLNETAGLNSVYYEVTASGYQPLHFNQLVPTTKSLKFGMTNEQLDQEIANYLDFGELTSLKVEKFIDYPDTSKLEDTTGKVQVSETLSTGKKVYYEYTIPFTVDSESTIDVSLPTTMLFGSTDVQEGQIVSPEYTLKNLGPVPLKVNVNKVSIQNNADNLTLLSAGDKDPTDKQDAVKLYLQYKRSDSSVLNSMPLLEETKETIGTLNAQSELSLEVTGTYFGEYGAEQKLDLAIEFGLTVDN